MKTNLTFAPVLSVISDYKILLLENVSNPGIFLTVFKTSETYTDELFRGSRFPVTPKMNIRDGAAL